MDTKQREAVIRRYLGSSPSWLDLRKKEILNDNINIKQWHINMNFLVDKYGSIDSSEIEAFEYWTENFINNPEYDNFGIEEYYKKNVTPVLLSIADSDLPRIFHRDQDRNWFLASYPDVFEYFYPQIDSLAEDFDAEYKRVEDHLKAVKVDYERMEQCLATGKGNQTTYLIRMKNFYRNDLKKKFLLCF